jgi:hypothetical protein
LVPGSNPGGVTVLNQLNMSPLLVDLSVWDATFQSFDP